MTSQMSPTAAWQPDASSVRPTMRVSVPSTGGGGRLAARARPAVRCCSRHMRGALGTEVVADGHAGSSASSSVPSASSARQARCPRARVGAIVAEQAAASRRRGAPRSVHRCWNCRWSRDSRRAPAADLRAVPLALADRAWRAARARWRRRPDAGELCMSRAATRQQAHRSRMMPMTCVGSRRSSRRTRCLAMISASRVSSLLDPASSSSSGFASVPTMASSAAICTSTSPMRALSSASPLRTPSTCPASKPCSQASRSTAARCMTLTPPLPRAHAAAIDRRTDPSARRRLRLRPRAQTYCSPPLPPSAIVPSSASLRAASRISFCAPSTSDELAPGPCCEVVLHHLGRALRHVLEDLRLEFFVGALEREQ